MKTNILFQVDAFASDVFKGNPAAVCPLEEWLEDEIMQSIAKENNLAETAFFVIGDEKIQLRWFTPEFEIDLCGHATLASAHVLFHYLEWGKPEISFSTKSGTLTVTKKDDLIEMDFPSRPGEPIESPKELILGLGVEPSEVYKSRDFMAVFETEEEVAALDPDFHALSVLDCVGIIATAPSNREGIDFVSRFFAPRAGVNEDPVTGSAHSTLSPYWSNVLGKNGMVAEQISNRGGKLILLQSDDRVKISGEAITYMRGEIYLP